MNFDVKNRTINQENIMPTVLKLRPPRWLISCRCHVDAKPNSTQHLDMCVNSVHLRAYAGTVDGVIEPLYDYMS